MTNLETYIESIANKYGKGTVLGLDNIKALLFTLGNPEQRLPKVIHVAGTNGKGSVTAFTKAFAEADGLKVHSYISPHLVRYNERITLSGEEISDEQLYSYLEKVVQIAKKAELVPTFFELFTSAAVLAFSENPADILILETGLGGRLDATNVVNNPVATVITSISKDHTDMLGNTLEEIAFEKAGIFKEGAVGIIAACDDSVKQVFLETAKAKGIKELFIEGEDFSVSPINEQAGFLYNDTLYPSPYLRGEHQYHNAAIAITVAKQVLNLSEQAIIKGLSSVRWKGRLQQLTSGELLNLLKEKGLNQGQYNNEVPSVEIWVDGGHNYGAGKALTSFLPAFKDKPLYAIFGMIKTKNPQEMFEMVGSFFDKIYTVPVSDEHSSYTPKELVDIAYDIGLPACEAIDFKSALEKITEEEQIVLKEKGGRIFIFGSLYLLGEVFKNNA